MKTFLLIFLLSPLAYGSLDLSSKHNLSVKGAVRLTKTFGWSTRAESKYQTPKDATAACQSEQDQLIKKLSAHGAWILRKSSCQARTSTLPRRSRGETGEAEEGRETEEVQMGSAILYVEFLK